MKAIIYAMKGGMTVGKSYADEQLESAFDKYKTAIEKFCRIRLQEAQDNTCDCVQETFCVYYKKLLDGERFENPRAFLYKTANIMVLKARENYFKNAKKTQSLDESINVAVYIDEQVDELVEPDIVDIDKAKKILLSKLDDDDLRLYQLKYVDRKSLKEIALILDITPTACAMRTSRLRTKIKDLVVPILSEIRKGGS